MAIVPTLDHLIRLLIGQPILHDASFAQAHLSRSPLKTWFFLSGKATPNFWVMVKRVAIIGAGASGLCAAKHILECTSYLPVIYDQRANVGGFWSPTVSSDGAPSAPQMGGLQTNLSKWNCSFSDFSWGPQQTRVFPTAAEVGNYLGRYKQRFLSGNEVSWKLGYKVNKVEKINDGTNLAWAVTGEDGTKEVYSALIMATGFFSRPHTPKIQGQEAFTGTISHSSNLQQFISRLREEDGKLKRRRKVVVVGGSLSAVEVVSELLFLDKDYIEIQHISPQPFWILPKQLPVNHSVPGPSFLPLDLILYDASSTGSTTSNHEAEKHAKLARLVDERQSYTGDRTKNPNSPTWVAISDWYSRFLREKKVELIHGRVLKFAEGRITVDLLEGGSCDIEDVTDIIYATGYTPCPGLSEVLPRSLLEELEFDSEDQLLPLILQDTQFSQALLPGGCFIGMYKGPYFGIIEGQARRVASWLAQTEGKCLPDRNSRVLDPDHIRTLRIDRRNGPTGQWLLGDYIKEMNSLACRTTTDAIGPGTLDPVIPALYSKSMTCPDTAAQILELREAVADEARYLPMAIWRAFHGKWKLSRTIHSKNNHQPSGTMQGSANFVPRFYTEVVPKQCNLSSAQPVDSSAASLTIPEVELLYSEEGSFATQTNPPFTFQVYKHYVYRLDFTNETPVISTYFTTAEKRATDAKANSFFHDLQFRKNSEGRWIATGDHWCKPDTYIPEYEFWFEGIELRKWTLTYTVTGPKKDYVSCSTFTRG